MKFAHAVQVNIIMLQMQIAELDYVLNLTVHTSWSRM